MKWILSLTLFVSFSSSVHAEVAMEHVESMLQQMVRENVISATEAEKAKIRMRTMDPGQWAAINQQAAKVATRTPASATPSSNKIEEVHGIDLDGAQFKAIQNEVRKIVPQYKD
jgi:hypothetical protein